MPRQYTKVKRVSVEVLPPESGRKTNREIAESFEPTKKQIQEHRTANSN